MKTLFTFMLCIMMYCCTSCTGNRLQEPQTPLFIMESLREIAQREAEAIVEDYPKDAYALMIFFDEAPGSLPMALTTGRDNRYMTGCYWDVYQYRGQQWHMADGIRDYKVFAWDNEFLILREDGKKPKLVVITSEKKSIEIEYNGYPEWEDYISRVSYQIAIDKKGSLKIIPMPEFEARDIPLGIQGRLETYCFDGFPEIKLKSPNDKLEPVQVETFYPKGFVKEK